MSSSIGMEANVAAEPKRTSFVRARVMATLSRCQSVSSRPARCELLQRTKDSRMADLSQPWYLSTVSTTAPPLSVLSTLAPSPTSGAPLETPLGTPASSKP
ncbi:hypothetical protein Vretimale_3869 [Volvox reticuliferus]|uniref:Uncharacterized protein n=1 Tax=Volvox reticuliferus TaxID=1737510 RepID=A0A8J4D9Z2_9CHLO|nr:hypothetical protein Vretimale_3869 [Volvox reticuliferus]